MICQKKGLKTSWDLSQSFTPPKLIIDAKEQLREDLHPFLYIYVGNVAILWKKFKGNEEVKETYCSRT